MKIAQPLLSPKQVLQKHLKMSQLSQLSGISDLISDADLQFIEENEIGSDVGRFLQENPIKSEDLRNVCQDDEDYKAAPADFFEAPTPPTSATLDESFPPDQPIDLCIEEYPGPHNFEVAIIANERRTPWEFSSELNKLFVGISVKFPVAFRVSPRPNTCLFVRATPVYSQAQFFQDPVHRCVGHQHPQDVSNKGVPEHILKHIMRCSNENVRYFGSQNENLRPNLVVPLTPPQAGSDTGREFFYFVCKNSCPLGMNRRPIQIIFSLENRSGRVLGRRVVSVRVCSCPKRDREKEERDALRIAAPPTPRHGKRMRLAAPSDGIEIDTRTFSLNCTVVGKHNLIKMLQFARALMADEIIKLEGSDGADAPFRRALNEINALIRRESTD